MSSAQQWRWNSVALVWQCFDEKEQLWYAEHRPLPDWFLEAQGHISFGKFIEIWQQAINLNDVKKELFWMDLDEIEHLRSLVSATLDRKGLKPLQELSIVQMSLLTESEINDLVSKSLLEKEEFYEQEGDVYDPVKALLRAQSQKEDSGTPHIQTMEIGGKYRFQVKH